MKQLLDGKTALVTGDRGRLGPVWKAALAEAGASVVGVDQADYDLRDPAKVLELAAHFDYVDILVNNAGVDSRPDRAADPSEVLAVNVLAADLLCHHIGYAMAGRKRGAIVNIASLYGLVAPDLRYYAHRDDHFVKDTMYGASKAALIQLTRDYAGRLGWAGVRVNALAPGGVVFDGDGLTGADPEFARKYTSRIPMGRMARPQDLGGPLVFLASELASFVNGQVLPLEGGYLVW